MQEHISLASINQLLGEDLKDGNRASQTFRAFITQPKWQYENFEAWIQEAIARFLRLPHRGPAAGLRGCAPGAGRRATGGAAMGKQVLRVPLVVSLYLSGMPERPAAVEKEEK